MTLLHSLAACAAMSFAALALAQDSSEQYDFDLRAMRLTDAVLELSQQTGLSVGYSPLTPQDEAVVVGPLRGRYNIEAALRKLLAPHGLAFTRSSERHLMIQTPSDKAGAPQTRERLAEKTIDKPHARTRPAPEGSARPDASGSAAYAPSDAEIDGVLVTGTRLRQRHGEGPAPVLTFTREKLDQLGVSTLAEAMQYVPQQPFAYSESHRMNGQYAEIRGLGPDATLVLINGRRVAPSATSVAVNAFDLNTIPLMAVERVEVLAASASAVYGADAMGGVVNVILKQDAPELAFHVRYGGAAGGADERRVSVSAGRSGARFSGSVVLDYFDRNPLLGEERDRWRDQDYRRFGAQDRRSLNANPGNVASMTTANLPSLPSRVAAVPHAATASAADFGPTAGMQNLDSPLRFWSAIPATDRGSVAAYGDLRMTPQIAGFGEVLYTTRNAEFQSEPSAIAGSVVPESNPFNPFATPVVVNYLLADLGPRRDRAEAELLRAAAGARGDWGAWGWELTALRSEESASITSSNWVDPARLSAALSSSDRASALNVFGAGPAGSPALLRSLTAPPFTHRFRAATTQGAGFVRGPAARLPAGDVSVVAGVEWRKDDLSGAGLSERQRNVSGVFSELQIPLVSPRAGIAGLRELSLTLAARIDQYSGFDDKLNPQFGVVWRPHADFTLRTSYGESFRPPSLYELYAPRILTPAQFQDARRNGETASFHVVSGGNVSLEPTKGDSFTTGVVYAPLANAAFKAVASYWRTRVDNRVAVLPPARALAAESALPDRVQRAEATPADAAAGLPGPLRLIDASYGNFGGIETSGVDLEASYTFQTALGRLTPRIVAVWTSEFDCIDQPGGAAANRVGVASPLGTIPRWRGVASLEWRRGVWSSSATARYTHSYDDANAFVRTQRNVSARTLIDVQAELEVGDLVDADPLQGLTITVGVQNLFDDEPDFSEVNTVTGYDLSQGDLRQRFTYLSVSKRF